MGVLPLIFFRIYMPQSQEYKAVKSLENAINDYNWSPRRFAENITEKQTEEEAPQTYYEYDSYMLTVKNHSNLENDISNNYDDWLEKAKQLECDELAAEVRAKRDALLADTDKDFVLDRINLNIPEKVTASTMLNAVEDIFSVLGSVGSGEMAKYRQALRDIPAQEGFPYNVRFPNKPK